MVPPADPDALSPAELRALVSTLMGKVADLERTVAAQREEIARLRGLKGRPPLKPSGMEQASEPKPRDRPGCRRGKVVPRVAVEERVIRTTVPAGSRFRGYQDFLVQDLVLRTEAVRYRRERWLTPDGQLVVAPLPGGVDGHFGPELRRYVLAQCHQGQATVPRLVAQFRAVGIAISKRQVMRLLIAGQQRFLAEGRDVLRAGLASAAWVTVDDTGARHKGANGSCTQIGNAHFAWFGTSPSRSRLNFLELLRAGHGDYVVNAEALAYMRDRVLAGPLIERLADQSARHFPDQAAWVAHLERLGIRGMEGSLGPARVATEGALWGAIRAHGLLPGTVIVSDDAGQFRLGEHALCWVHAERLVHKLDAFTDHQRAARARMRALIWWFYADLKAYRREPSRRRRAELRARFDRLFRRRTGFATLDRLLERLHANKAELLRALDRPEIPLHTNGSENDIRAQVTRRKVSGGTRSDTGRDCRDAFLGLAKTCAKLGLSFWDYLGARLGITGQPAVPYLPDLIRARCQPA
jgi:Transposase IS66 family